MRISDYAYDSIDEGMEAEQLYAITAQIHEGFLALFQDYSPIHVDDAYARARGFDQKVMHGAILNGFISHFVGVYFPGERSLLLSTDVRFANPCYLGDEIRITATVAQKMDAQRVIVLRVALENETRANRAASARVQVQIAAG